MTTISLSPVEIMAGVGALLVLLLVWRTGARRAKAAADAARSGARLVSLFGRVLFTAGLIGGVQWVVLTHGPELWLVLTVLGLPALFASYTITKALTVTTHDMPRRRGGGRR
ncbi:hypothetical protein [Kutzneria buriramensis]|uniref:Uncharacterized protein n=1 Tax=Kutzneria buriramensis TaxID=1045776 RepID=A0A3E0HFS7_9PSEU|nr:hypothetical protein [Kutzneria buriramensis]REH44655.1 hypothetical protein BCF44_108135 [Kutzneria buriramensis]